MCARLLRTLAQAVNAGAHFEVFSLRQEVILITATGRFAPINQLPDGTWDKEEGAKGVEVKKTMTKYDCWPVPRT